ncbi:MAG: sulfite exporter TauE/SafE family protein [Acidimicrobiia bacterium]
MLTVAGFVVGMVVGLTGMGGGALMTPILVLLFNTDPLKAVSSDLVVSLVMKPVGAGVHMKRGSVDKRLVLPLVAGSVPFALVGSALASRLGDNAEQLKLILGVALCVAAAAMAAKTIIGHHRVGAPVTDTVKVRIVPTFLIGVLGGIMVGITSVGSGSLMMVLLMALYPTLSTRNLVGIDLVQAVPLVASATIGHLFFGHVSFGLAWWLLLGALPGCYLGARLSTRASDHHIRPLLIVVLLVSALKLLKVGNEIVVVFAVGATIVVVGSALLARHRRPAATATATGAAPDAAALPIV